MDTPDATHSERVVRNLYLGILRRPPEADALVHWSRLIDGGMDINEVLDAFLSSDEFRRQQIGAPLAYPPGHFYSPVVDPAAIEERFRRALAEPVPQSLPGITISIDAQEALWREMMPLFSEIPFPDREASGFRYHFENHNYSYGDASILYGMLRHFKPKRLIEVGCGFSSACSLDTIDRYMLGRVKVTFVEPYAQLFRDVVGPNPGTGITLHELPVQQVSLGIFDDLERNDILFIDSTHVVKTDSDVCRELFDVLPRLNSGVLVHFHDILWPFEYGEDWVLKENRSWNEIYALRAFLMYNQDFEILFFNDFFRRWRRELIEKTYPKFLKNTGGAIWLRRR